MIVLDATVLIAHLDANDAHHTAATALLVDHTDESFGASPITLAETLVGPERRGMLDQTQEAIDRLGVTTLPLGEDAPVALARLRSATSLKLPDCCVLFAAESRRAAVATFDAALASAARQRGTRLTTGDRGSN